MASSGVLRCVALVKTDVSEERSASIISIRISEPGNLAVSSNRRTLRRKSGLRRATRRNVPEDVILHIHSREILKSYKLRCY
jgi:hypothetical protein